MKLASVTPLFVSLALLLTGCGPSTARKNWASQITGGGDFDRGKSAILKYGCVACHTVDGIQVSQALVGPPLTHMASRSYVAGMLENTPPNLMHWIQNRTR